jgi:hypothetical protein
MLVKGAQPWREKRQLNLIDSMKKRIHCLEARNARSQRLAVVEQKLSAKRDEVRKKYMNHRKQVKDSLKLQKILPLSKVQSLAPSSARQLN